MDIDDLNDDDLAAKDIDTGEGLEEGPQDGDDTGADELDLTKPMFAVTNDDGSTTELTGQEMLDRIARAEKATTLESQVQQLQAQLAAASQTRPLEQKTELEVKPQGTNWDEVGTNI